MSWTRAGETFNSELPELIRKLAANGTWMDPTFVTAWELTKRAELAGQPDNRRNYIAASVRQSWDKAWPVKPESPDTAKARLAVFDSFLQWAAQMNGEGIRFVTGTDVGVRDIFPGFSVHDELAWMVKAGFSEMEALQAATRNPAMVLGKAGELGTVEKGKYADLVVLDADPLKSIDNTKKIRAVLVRGQLLRRNRLDELLAKVEASCAKR
jgi:hypothetical protein